MRLRFGIYCEQGKRPRFGHCAQAAAYRRSHSITRKFGARR
jgi:hypothetical protein